ncbi:hypothetical protein N473_20205, partial [Pseudoalteromonas luteoviolacea CPMOR-1]
SIQERIKHLQKIKAKAKKSTQNNEAVHQAQQPKSLKPFGKREYEHTLPFSLLDYLELVEWTGRHVHSKKKAHILKRMPDILASLRIEESDWLDRVKNYSNHYGNFVGSQTVLRAHAAKNDMNWYKGVG